MSTIGTKKLNENKSVKKSSDFTCDSVATRSSNLNNLSPTLLLPPLQPLQHIHPSPSCACATFTFVKRNSVAFVRTERSNKWIINCKCVSNYFKLVRVWATQTCARVLKHILRWFELFPPTQATLAATAAFLQSARAQIRLHYDDGRGVFLGCFKHTRASKRF